MGLFLYEAAKFNKKFEPAARNASLVRNLCNRRQITIEVEVRFYLTALYIIHFMPAKK